MLWLLLNWSGNKTRTPWQRAWQREVAEATGHHPTTRGLHQEWFRRAVLEGIPEKVREKMFDDSDLMGADAHRWEKHLVHYLEKHKQGKDKKKGDLEELQEQLLKLILGEAKQQVTDKKKEAKAAKVMVAQGYPPDSNCPDFYSNTHPQNPYSGHYDGLQDPPMASWGGQEALVAWWV